MTRPRSVAPVLWCVVLGAIVGVVGTGVHRLNPPVGIILAIVVVASAAVLARAWVGASGVVAMGVGLVVVVGAMGTVGPGGDVIVVAQPVGYAWYLGVLVLPAIGLLPRRWFSDEPIRRPGGVDPGPS